MVRGIGKETGYDTVAIFLYIACILWGWINIYAAVYQVDNPSMLNFNLNSTKQLMWIGVAIIFILVVSAIDFRTYEAFAFLVYFFGLCLLLFVLLFGREISGSKSWFAIGSFRMQPSEIMKYATSLALAKYLSDINVRMENTRTKLVATAIILLPAFLILMQKDLGSSMVFTSFIFVLYREGLPHWIVILFFSIIALFVFALFLGTNHIIYLVVVILSISLTVLLISRLYFSKSNRTVILILSLTALSIVFVYSVDYLVNNVLRGYQRDRIMVLVNPDDNKVRLSAGWNVTQSKIAIGSGGLFGKGFLGGTQTKLDFVPEQSTDFIFCTIGEEYGWVGSFLTIALFMVLLYRILYIAERQKDSFARIYGYSVASVIFFHFAINIAMTIGLFPVVGLPLPFFSYGGSSLISFSIMFFTLLKLDSHRSQMLARK